FDNVNQWAASIGGPIRKGKTFFFLDTEGLRVVLPVEEAGGNLINVPSPQFQTAALANIAATQPAQLPFYQRMFTLYSNAPGSRAARNTLPNRGCPTASSGSAFSLPGGAPCALQFLAQPKNLTREWLLTGRVDQNIGNNDRAFIHFRTDHGFQATYTDPI